MNAPTPVATSTLPKHLKRLEAESIEIIREVVAEFKNPVMLYSIGKDSGVMLHLAIKAFHPAPLPFPLMHVDTGHNFDEVIAFRDETVGRYNLRLEIGSVQDDIDSGAERGCELILGRDQIEVGRFRRELHEHASR